MIIFLDIFARQKLIPQISKIFTLKRTSNVFEWFNDAARMYVYTFIYTHTNKEFVSLFIHYFAYSTNETIHAILYFDIDIKIYLRVSIRQSNLCQYKNCKNIYAKL